MESLQQNEYELITLQWYGRFLQTFYWNLNKNEKNKDLTMTLYNMCMDWLSTLKNGYTVIRVCEQFDDHTYNCTRQQQVGANTVKLDSYS